MRHCDSELHVTGRSQYLDDVEPPAGMLHGAVFASPVAHGTIKALDTRPALEVPGVRAVYTFADIPGNGYIGPVKQDEPLFAYERVMYQGHQLALVVADTAELARKGVRACSVEIDPLPVITCPREAFAKGDTLQEPRIYEMGDVDAAWDSCDVVVEGEVDLGGQEHIYLETNRARVIPREDGQYMVYTSTQSPSAAQKFIARILDIPMHKVEVDVKRLGGGFGGKEDQATHWACMAALAASKLRRPVQVVLSRAEDQRMTGKRHPYKQDYKIGLSRDGKILAYEVSHFQDSGAFVDLSPPVLERSVVHSTNAYDIPNLRIRAAACRTNTPPNTAFRGFGGPQGMFPLECAIAHAANALGLSPDAIQDRNILRDGHTFHYGQKIEDDRMRRTWDEALEGFDIAGIKDRVAAFNTAHTDRKKGFALMPVCFGISFTKTFMNQGSSLVHIYVDGSVSVATGGIEMGQGVSSNMIAICARTLGIPESRVRCNSTNTSRIANISPSAASATTDLNGNATVIACNELLEGLRKVAARVLDKTDPQKISLREGIVHYDGEATQLGWEKLVLETFMSRTQLMAHGFYTPIHLHFDPVKGKGLPFNYYTYGTCLIEATVDCLRGIYTIDSAKIVHDLGRSIIPSVDLGQVEGGLAQGIGWVTLEELKYADDGRLMSHALSTYKTPDGDFMPDDMEVRFLEGVDNPAAPLGTKAVGEPPFMYGIAAYFAVRNAINAFRRIDTGKVKCPMTPEQTLLNLYAGDRVLKPAKPSEAASG